MNKHLLAFSAYLAHTSLLKLNKIPLGNSFLGELVLVIIPWASAVCTTYNYENLFNKINNQTNVKYWTKEYRKLHPLALSIALSARQVCQKIKM